MYILRSFSAGEMQYVIDVIHFWNEENSVAAMRSDYNELSVYY